MAGKQAQLEVKQEVTLGIQGKLECDEKFRYLGDMIEAGAGADEASKARVRNAWIQFKQLIPILTFEELPSE